MTENKQELRYDGGLYNLTGGALVILKRQDQFKPTYPEETGWQPYLVWPAGQKYMMGQAAELEAPVIRQTEVVGSFNNFIDLVRPTASVQELVAFWRAKYDCGVRLYGHPDMKKLRKTPGMRMYCAMPLSMAIMAYLQREEIERILVPADIVVDSESGLAKGYKALMPLECIVESIGK